jgi:hypothetical protein
MSVVRNELVNSVFREAFAITMYDPDHDTDKLFELRKRYILANKSLTKDEKSVVVRRLSMVYDRNKIRLNKGKKRNCENCRLKCLATLYCEYCVQHYLKEKFSNWTSGNNDIDNLIQECQMKTFSPDMIVEWIPYDNLKNIKYLTKGGFSEIYIGDWKDGNYIEWDSKEQQLKRKGTMSVILKRLKNVKSAGRSWFEEVCNLKVFKRLLLSIGIFIFYYKNCLLLYLG